MSQSVPETMTCIEITEPGGPEVLKPTTRPVPRPSSQEVLVKVEAAGVNGPDVVQRQGRYPAPPGVTDIPGLEIAGTVVQVGEESEGLIVGDRVCALVGGGGYAEYCTALPAHCLPVPRGLEMMEAACLPETFFTVWHNVFERAALKAGESFLVHGGAGGIGTTAIQMASRLGARVMTTVATDVQAEFCQELGAEKAINYNESDFVEVAKEFGGGKGVDVILDIIGGDYVARNIASLNRDGRLVNIAFNKGSKVEINLMPVMLKRLTLTGSTLRVQSVERKTAIANSLKEKVWPFIERGEIMPILHAAFPLAEAAAAHATMEAGKHTGKIVLTL